MGNDTDEFRLRAFRELAKAATLPDTGAEPEPEDPDFISTQLNGEAAAGTFGKVKWPSNDQDAPDCNYVADEPDLARAAGGFVGYIYSLQQQERLKSVTRPILGHDLRDAGAGLADVSQAASG